MIRESIPMICQGYAEVSNELLKSQILPNQTYGSLFLWVDPEKLNLDNYPDDGPIGCLLEVDLDYPDELHELHNDYPLAAEKKSIKKNAV